MKCTTLEGFNISNAIGIWKSYQILGTMYVTYRFLPKFVNRIRIHVFIIKFKVEINQKCLSLNVRAFDYLKWWKEFLKLVANYSIDWLINEKRHSNYKITRKKNSIKFPIIDDMHFFLCLKKHSGQHHCLNDDKR